MRASSSACSSTSAASRRSSRARSAGATAARPGTRPSRAATAASVSSTARLVELDDRLLGRRVETTARHRALLAVARGLLDERLEERGVLALLGVPEDAEREAPGRILERLDRAVVGAGGLAQALAEAAVALVVVALDRRVLAERRAAAVLREDVDVVVGEDARRLLVPLVADDLGEVLDEVAAQRDVQHLASAADGEHGHVARERRLEERELGRSRSGRSPFVSGVASAP